MDGRHGAPRSARRAFRWCSRRTKCEHCSPSSTARWLASSLLYATGMRLLEGLRLRVKDVDFERPETAVRDGKGGRDRRTMLPERLIEPLRSHLARVKPRSCSATRTFRPR